MKEKTLLQRTLLTVAMMLVACVVFVGGTSLVAVFLAEKMVSPAASEAPPLPSPKDAPKSGPNAGASRPANAS